MSTIICLSEAFSAQVRKDLPDAATLWGMRNKMAKLMNLPEVEPTDDARAAEEACMDMVDIIRADLRRQKILPFPTRMN